MNLTDFFAALRRRWLILVLGLVVTAGLTGAAYEYSTPTYEITGSVLLLPPRASMGTQVDNPYLQLDGLRQAVDLLGVSLSDQSTQLQLQAMSKDVEFTVQANPAIASPLLVIDVKDSSPESARAIRDVLMARVPVQLKQMQAALGVAAADQVTSSVVTRDAKALEVGRNRLRAGVVVAVAGLVITLAAVALWDAHRLRRPKHPVRGRNHTQRPGAPPTGDDDPSPGDEPEHAGSVEETVEPPLGRTGDAWPSRRGRLRSTSAGDDLGEPVGTPATRP